MDWTIVTAISTGVIAVFAVSNFVLALNIIRMNEQLQAKFTDSLQAVVVATICSAGQTPDEHSVRSVKGWFKKFYNGKTSYNNF